MKHLGWFFFVATLLVWVVIEIYAADPLALQLEALITKHASLEERTLKAELRSKELELELIELRTDCEQQLRSANEILLRHLEDLRGDNGGQ